MALRGGCVCDVRWRLCGGESHRLVQRVWGTRLDEVLPHAHGGGRHVHHHLAVVVHERWVQGDVLLLLFPHLLLSPGLLREVLPFATTSVLFPKQQYNLHAPYLGSWWQGPLIQ
jgi:hypothetical protein